MSSAPDADQQPTDLRRDIDTVCRHLTLVAIDGATDEVALTLDPAFRLHIDKLETDRWGYLTLIEANHAAHATRPPLDVVSVFSSGGYVSARLEPRCLAHFCVKDGIITELWMTVDWNVWSQWLVKLTLT